MKRFKVSVARILSDYPVKTFTVLAHDIVAAQTRVLRKVKTWYRVVAAEEDKEITK